MSEPETRPPDELEREFEEVRALVERSKAGDSSAVHELIGRYYARVVRIVRLQMFHRLRHKVEAEDIVSSALGKGVVEKFADFEFREPASLVNWLAGIAFNKMRDKRRYFDAECRAETLEVFIDACSDGREESRAPFQLAAEGTHPPEKAAREERRLAVDTCVSELPDDYRDVLRMMEYERASAAYAASRLSRSEKAVWELRRRALQSLEKKLVANGIDGA